MNACYHSAQSLFSPHVLSKCITYKLTPTMVQSPSYEAYGFPANKLPEFYST